MSDEVVGALVVGADLPSSPAEAREQVAGLLRTQFLSGREIGQDDVVWADALLVTSELVTNAYRHGVCLTGFAARIEGDELLLSVADQSAALPVLPARAKGEFTTTGGYGWAMVNRLAKRLSVIPTDDGKRIEAAVPLV